MEGREDVGLIHRAHLLLQRDAGKEHPKALFCQTIIDFLCKQGVARALAVLICFLIADEHIERLFILRNRKDAALHLGDFFRFLAVAFAGERVCVLQRRQIVHVLKEAVETGAVAGGQPFMRGRVLHVFDTEAAQRAAPVRLSVGFIFLYDTLVYGQRLVKFADAPKVVAAVEGGSPLFIVDEGQRHGGTAAVTGADASVLGQYNVAAAHFAFDDCHWFITPIRRYSFVISRLSSANSRAITISSFRVRPVSSASVSNACAISLGTRTEITVEAAAYFLGVTLKADAGICGIIFHHLLQL